MSINLKKVKDIKKADKQREEKQGLLDEISFLKSDNSALSLQIKGYRNMDFRDRRFIGDMTKCIGALRPYPRFRFTSRSKRTTPVSLVLMLSDLHIGEIIFKSQMEGFNEYNFEIAQRRFFGMIESLIEYVYLMRNAYPINELRIFGLGDFFAGGIHEELSETNEFPVPEQCVKSAFMVSDGINKLSAHFDKIIFDNFLTDNHSRTTRKIRFKNRGATSHSYYLDPLFRGMLKDVKNVEINAIEGIKAVLRVQGKNFLCEHGNDIKGWAGIPIYGIQRELARESIRRMRTRDPKLMFDYLCMAHFHSPAKIGQVLMNGSLSGTSELDHASSRDAVPCQVSFLVHPEHGLFNWMEWCMK